MTRVLEISREIRFESAHKLPKAPEGHKCRRLHGHSFVAQISAIGTLDAAAGWIVDFAELAQWLEPIRLELDHHLLNDVPGLANPTSEEIAHWLWTRCEEELPGSLRLSEIRVQETCESEVRLRAVDVKGPESD